MDADPPPHGVKLARRNTAEAATVLVATREGVLAYSIFSLILGIAIGFILCWWTSPRVHAAAQQDAGLHPDVIQLRKTRVRP